MQKWRMYDVMSATEVSEIVGPRAKFLNDVLDCRWFVSYPDKQCIING